MSLPPLVALEIGTTRVRAIIGEAREDGHIMITGLGECPSRGVRKGEIIDFDNALACVRTALQNAEERSDVIINQVHLLVSGGDVQGLVNRGSIPVQSPHGEITQEDIDHCMETARAVSVSQDREILHTICQHFYVDGQPGVVNPEGMEGAKLAVDTLMLHGIRARLRNTVRVVRSVPMQVEDVAFSGLCSGLATLSPEQKESGAAVVDIGGGTIDYVLYAGNAIAGAGSLAIGGDHVTNDIARGLRIPISGAERLKEEYGSAMVNIAARGQQVPLSGDGGNDGRFVKLTDLNTIIHARMEEMFELVRAKWEENHILHMLGAGVVLTGGGAHLKRVDALAERVFGVPCMLGRPRDISGLALASEGPEFAAPVGMLRYGFKTAKRKEVSGGLGSFFRGLLGRS
jgi:cell division protein FtsA